MPASQLPGLPQFPSRRNPALRVGVLTGVYLSTVLIAWLILANRVPWLANFANLRNSTAGALFILLMLIPIGRFLGSPGRLLACGLASWAVLTFTYLLAGFFFGRLHSRMGPLHVFMLGAVVYGIVAVITWVARLVLAARQQPAGVSRRRSD